MQSRPKCVSDRVIQQGGGGGGGQDAASDGGRPCFAAPTWLALCVKGMQGTSTSYNALNQRKRLAELFLPAEVYR